MADFNINVIVDTRNAEQGVQRVDRSLTAVERSLNRINRVIAGVFAFQAVGGAVRSLTTLADTISNAENRVRSLGIQGDQLNGTIGSLFEVANRTRQSFTATSEVFTRTAASLRILGLGTDEALQLTESLNQAVALSGATSAEASAALIQFSQGLASGALRGEELNSVLEQVPVVADVIADRLGVTRNELRLLAQQGTITPQLIVSAFRDAREELADRFAVLIPTIGQSFTVLNNRVIELAGGFLTSSGASSAFASAILAVADNMEVVLRSAAALAVALGTVLATQAIPAVVTGLNAIALAVARNPLGALAIAVSTAIGFLTTFADQLRFTNDGMVTLADIASVVFGRLADVVSGAFNAVTGFINQFIPNLNLVTISFEDIATGAAAALDILVAVFNGTVAGIGAAVDNLGPVLTDAFVSGLNGAIEAVEDGINFIIQGFAGLPGALFDSAREAVLSFAQVFDIGFDDIVGFVTSIPGRIRDALAGLFTTGAEAGRSLVEGIDEAINVGVDTTTGTIQVELGRLENPASGALRQVGDVAGQEFGRTLEQAPVSQALEGVINDARTNTLPVAQAVGNDLGAATGTAISDAVFAERGRLEQALGGLFDAVTNFTGQSEQEFQNFVSNISTILGGVDLDQAFGNALQGLANLIGVAGSDLTNALGGVFNILGELGFELEDVFGRRGTQAINLLSAVTSEQFQSMLRVGQSVFGGIGALVSGLLPSIAAFGAGAIAAFQGLASAAVAATVAMGPIGLIFAAIAVAVIALIAIFGDLGDAIDFLSSLFTKLGGDGSTAARILQIVFAPVILPIIAIVEVVEFLIDVFSNLGDVGGTVGAILSAVFAPVVIPIRIIIEVVQFLIDLFSNLGSVGSTIGTVLTVAFAPIIIPIRLIISAVEFLINLFSNLGNVGGTVGTVLAVVFAPIVIPIRLIIAAVEFLIDLFSNLGDAGRAVGAVLSAVFNAFLAVGRAVFSALQAAGQAAFSALQAIGQGVLNVLQGAFNVFRNLFTGVFNALQSIATAVFNAVRAVGQAVLGALQAAFNVFRNAFTAVFNFLSSIASAVFNAVRSFGQAALNALQGAFNVFRNLVSGVFNAIQSIASSVFNAIRSIATSALSAISGAFNALRNLVSGVFSAIAGFARSAFNALRSIATSAINAVGSALRSLGNIASGIFSGIAGVARSAFNSIASVAKSAVNAAGGALKSLGNTAKDVAKKVTGGLGSVAKGIGGAVGGIGKAVGKVFGFAEGGVINGPISLDGAGLGGKAFARGGVLPTNTLLGGSSNITPTGKLGIAGEAGPEAIMPLTKTSQGLGVTASISPELLRALGLGNENAQRGSGGTTIVNRIVLISTNSDTVEDLQEQVLDLNASVEERLDVRLSEILAEVA